MSRESLGDVEHLVLLALVRLGDRSYGVPILDEITGRTGRVLSRAAVYVALRRLTAKGLLTSEMGGATAERGGRAKRYFAITAEGHRQLEASRAALLSMWTDVKDLRTTKVRP